MKMSEIVGTCLMVGVTFFLTGLGIGSQVRNGPVHAAQVDLTTPCAVPAGGFRVVNGTDHTITVTIGEDKAKWITDFHIPALGDLKSSENFNADPKVRVTK